MTDKITVGLDVEGYDVEVEICTDCIEKHIGKLERDKAERINMDGTDFMARYLSKFAQVKVEPTDEKWKELADKQFGEEE